MTLLARAQGPIASRRWIQETRFQHVHSPESNDTGAGRILDSDYSAQRNGLHVLGAVALRRRLDPFR